jgi:hypothetical protein
MHLHAASSGTLRIIRKNASIDGQRCVISGSMQAWIALANNGLMSGQYS